MKIGVKQIDEIGQPIFGVVQGNITNVSTGAVGFFSVHSTNIISTKKKWFGGRNTTLWFIIMFNSESWCTIICLN